jgi:2-methylcitrate dehydratase PrpD
MAPLPQSRTKKRERPVGATDDVARFVAEGKLENVPPDVVAKAKRALADCLGVALAGATVPPSGMVLDFIRENGGAPRAGIVGTTLRASLQDAALGNGMLASALLYDDTSLAMQGHSTATLLPVLLALGETLHRSGREILDAYLIGFEVEAAIGRTILPEHYERGWHATATIGTLGATVAACRLMRLPLDKVRMALGLGATMASGSRQNFGTMTQALHGGLPARNGVVAASLAARGFTADAEILESRMGFFTLFGPNDRKVEAKTTALGEEWALQGPVLAMKLYPCGFPLHRPIEGAIDLAKELDLKAGDVEEITCGVHYLVPETVFHDNPQTGLQGKTSISYCVARALIDRRMGTAQFTDEKVQDPQVRELMARVKVEVPPELSAEAVRGKVASIAAPLFMETRLRDGRVIKRRIDYYRGDPNRPLSDADVAEKFRDCAAMVLKPERAEAVLETMMNIETLDDTARLVTLCVPEA